MKRAGNLMAAVAEMENLRLAFWKAAKGKSASREVRAYREHLEENLLALRRRRVAQPSRLCFEGSTGGTPVSHCAGNTGGTPVSHCAPRYRFFKIHDPKERQICAAAFPERVFHHALMNVCEPHLERRLIADTYACRKGKGRIAAIERAQRFARGHAWYLKMDVRRYFDSIDHDVLAGLLRRVFKDRALLSALEEIIGSYAVAPGKGVPIGNLTSQHFANLYLGELDIFVKHGLRVRGYVRYMDDFVLWADDRAALVDLRDRVEGFLAERLMLETKPAQINRVERGMPFLGCRLYPDRLRLDRRGRKRFAGKLAALERDFHGGKIGMLDLQARATALAAYTETCGARGFRRALLKRRGERCGVAGEGETAGSSRLLRGGNWNNDTSNCRVANRNNNSPGNTNNNNGFRCVRSSGCSPERENGSDPSAIPFGALRGVPTKRNGPPGASSAVDAAGENSGRAGFSQTMEVRG